MVNVKKHLSMLGLKVKDKVSGFTGVCTSVGFDLFGCIQCIINPGADKTGKLGDSHWFDIARLEVIEPTPVMEVPNFDFGVVAEGKKGPAEKPKNSKY